MKTLDNKINNIRVSAIPLIYKFINDLVKFHDVILYRCLKHKSQDDCYFVGGTFCVDYKLRKDMILLLMYNINGDNVSINFKSHGFDFTQNQPLSIKAIKVLSSIYVEHKPRYFNDVVKNELSIVSQLKF